MRPQIIRDIERSEIERARDVWADKENSRRELDAKEKKRAEFEQVSRDQRSQPPDFRPGDTVRVHSRVIEGDKERIQVFEGVVIARSHESVRASFTVRKISHSVGVERTFLLHSPRVERIDVVRYGRVRRAKLYYLRGKVGKGTRIKEERSADRESS